MNKLRSNHVLAMAAAAALLAAVCLSTASAATLPMFKQQGDVTISLEEYNRLKRFEKLDLLFDLIDAYYYEDIDETEMLESAAIGLVAGVGDVYTCYYTAEEMDQFNEETEGEYSGIGCQLLANPEDKMITVTRVFDGSPAQKAGMRSGDRIIYVNDVYYSAYEMTEAVQVMRGVPGETVKVTVLRDLEQLDFDIMREVVNINYVEHRILDGNIGYLMIYDFLGDAVQGVTQALEAFRQAGVSGMIIDLRNNGGGLVEDSVAIADMILPEGKVVSVRDKAGREQVYTVDGDYYDVPMVVLVNEYTASASEILAGAIRDREAGCSGFQRKSPR